MSARSKSISLIIGIVAVIAAAVVVFVFYAQTSVPVQTSVATSTPSGNNGVPAYYHSGIRGVVMLGPTCPVMRVPPDPQCADKPYQTLVSIFRADDPAHAVVITKSGADGTFSAAVAPGDYTLGAGESNLPRCDHPAVTVGLNEFATTTITCDTGIR